MKHSFLLLLLGICFSLLCSTTTLAASKIPQLPKQNAASTFSFQNSFEQDMVQETGQGNRTLWSRLQKDQPLDTFTVSTTKAHTGLKSLSVKYDKQSWGSVISRTLENETQGEVSVYLFDSGNQPDGYLYLGVTELDPIDNPKLGNKGGASLGIYPKISKDHYVYCPTQELNGCMTSTVQRTPGWHKLTLRVTPLGTLGLIDNYNLAVLPANAITKALNTNLVSFGRINLGINTTSDSSEYYFDDLTVTPLQPVPDINTLSLSFIQQYLAIYSNISVKNVDELIKARLDDFCPVDYDWNGPTGPKCPVDGSTKRPIWHYKEQLFHVYDALLMTAGAHGLRYDKLGNPDDLTKSKEIIEYINAQYPNWRQREEECQLLEKHCVTGSIVGLILGHVSWLVWDDLDVDTQISITNHLMAEGAFYYKHLRPFSGYIGNSGGEENSWMASYLDRLSLIFRQRYETAPWYEKAKLIAFHALSTGEEYGGITTQTIYPDYLFDNHNYHPHPTYGSMTAFTLASLDFLRKDITGILTPEYEHNVANVWKKMSEFIDFRDFQYKGTKIKTVKATKPDRLSKKAKRDTSVLNSTISDLFSFTDIPTKPLIYTPLGVSIGSSDTLDETQGGFGVTGKNDWGADAAGLTQYSIMKDVIGVNTVKDSETGFTTNDLLQHAIDYMFYVRSGTLWKPEDENVAFREMLIDEPTDDRNERSSYKWYENAGFVWEFVSHFYYYDTIVKFKTTNICEDNLYKKREWTGTFNWACDTSTAFKGSKSLKLDFETPADGEVYSSLIPVEPNTIYTLTYVSKSKDLKKETSEILGRIVPAQYNSDVTEDSQVNEKRIDPGFGYGSDTSENQGWKRVTFDFSTDPETAYVRLRAIIGKGTGTGTVWFDDVRLTKKDTKYAGDMNGDTQIDGVDYVQILKSFDADSPTKTNDDYQRWLRDYLLQ